MNRLVKLIGVYSIFALVIVVIFFLGTYSHSKPVLESTNANKSQSEQKNQSVKKTQIVRKGHIDKDTKVPDSNFSRDGEKYIILTFDDGWSSQAKAAAMMKPLKGTLYICSGLIGQEDRLSLKNLQEMYHDGWDIANHTVHHTNLTKVDADKAYDEVYGCSAWIAGQGFTRGEAYKHLAYPEGAYNQGVIDILKEQDILTARTTNAGSETLDFLELGRMSLHGMTPKNIRDNILSNKKLLILSFHRLVPDDTAEMKEIDIKESYFKEVLEAIKASNRKVITITEWYASNSN